MFKYELEQNHIQHVVLNLQVLADMRRFARSPLVIRLGDSRIRLGSGYGEVLSSGTVTTHRTL